MGLIEYYFSYIFVNAFSPCIMQKYTDRLKTDLKSSDGASPVTCLFA